MVLHIVGTRSYSGMRECVDSPRTPQMTHGTLVLTVNIAGVRGSSSLSSALQFTLRPMGLASSAPRVRQLVITLTTINGCKDVSPIRVIRNQKYGDRTATMQQGNKTSIPYTAKPPQLRNRYA